MGSNASQPAKYDSYSYGCFVSFLILTTIGIIARSTSRWMLKASFGLDDAFAYLAYISNTASLINMIVVPTTGAFDLSRVILFGTVETQDFLKRNLASSALYLPIMLSAKMSLLFLFRRVFYVHHSGWFGVFWWLNVLLLFPCWSALTLGLLIYGQVRPFAFQNPEITWGIAACALINGVSDILILALPIHGVLKLQLHRAQKIGTVALFSVGFLTTAVSLSRAGLSFHQATMVVMWNPAYQNYHVMVLSAAETSASCFCACIPVTRPFFMKGIELASRSLGRTSLRGLISRSNFSSRTRGGTENSISNSANNKDTIYRTVEIDMDSIPLRQPEATQQSHERIKRSGYTEVHDTPAPARPWA